MGFKETWCSWISGCLKSASVSVMVNGSPTIEFKMERGLRQGDPLSPFLFLIVVEGLNAIVEEAVERNIFKCIEFDNSGTCLSNLQYADDTLLMGIWSKRNIEVMLRLLHCFGLVSSLKPNMSKT